MKIARLTRPVVAGRSPASRLFGQPAMSLGMAAGGYAITMSVFGTTTSLFLADAVRVGPGLIGLYFTACAGAAVVINLAVGWSSDRLADRRIALAATALAGAAAGLTFSAVRSYALILAAGAVLLSLNDAYISQLFAYVKEFAESTGRAVTPFSSAVRSIFSAGWIVGPPIGFLILTHLGFGVMYASAAGLLLLTALLSRWLLPALRVPPGPSTEGKPSTPGMLRVLASVPRRTWLLLGAVIAVNVADQMYLISIALYVTRDLHLSATLVGLMAALCAAIEIPLMIVVGRVADRIGKLRVMTAAAVVAVVFFGLVPVAGSAVALLALQVPNAMWTAVFAGIPMVMVQQEVPGGSGAVSSLYSTTFPVSLMSAGALTGVVATQAGYRNVFWVCAGLCVLAMVLLLCRAASRGPSDGRAPARADSSGRPEVVGVQSRGDLI